MQTTSARPRREGQLAAAPRRAAREPDARTLRFRSFGTPGTTAAMAADATAKARLERLLGELDKSAETPAGEDVDGGFDFFAFRNALDDPEEVENGFFEEVFESIDGRRAILLTPPPLPPLDELKGLLLFASRLRSLAMLSVFVFFLINSSSTSPPTIDSLLTLFALLTLLFSTRETLFCTAGKLSFAS